MYISKYPGGSYKALVHPLQIDQITQVPMYTWCGDTTASELQGKEAMGVRVHGMRFLYSMANLFRLLTRD